MKYSILILAFLSSIFSQAQSKFHVFLGPGISFYQGDVADRSLPTISMLKFNGKLGVGYDFTPRWGIRLHGSMGSLHGSDAYSNDTQKNLRGITFNTAITDIGLTLKYNNFFRSEKFINYLFFGVDYMNMDVAKTINSSIVLPAEEGFSNHQVNLPLGLGLGYWLSKRVGLALESSWHFTFTDYLDGTQSNRPDSYIDAHIMLMIRFGKIAGGKKEYNGACPEF